MRSELDVALMDGGLPADAEAVLASSREEVERMSRLVEDLLTLARVDAGRLDLLRQPVALSELAASVARSLAPMAKANGVTIAVAGETHSVPGDRDRLEQVLMNLVQNAVSHSEPGSTVRIDVWESGQAAGATVKDEGPGIPTSAQPHVFERFYRIDTARSRNNGGSGLGLAICREIVQAHGGRIWLDHGQRGSAFSFTVPAGGE